MQAQKLRVKAKGLVPAGGYFADIAAKFEEMNAQEAALRDELDDEDHALEKMHRWGARMTPRDESHAMM